MKNQDLFELGSQIQDIVQNAIDSNDYNELSQTIRKTLNVAVDSGSQVLRDALSGYANAGRRTTTAAEEERRRNLERRQQEEKRRQEEKKELALYQPMGGEQTKGILMTVGGGALTVTGIPFMILALTGVLGGIGSYLPFAAGIMLLAGGIEKIVNVSRFKKYKKVLKGKAYAEFSALAKVSGRSIKLVKRDIKRMIRKGWFLEGHVDQSETCLIASNEMYQQYQLIENQRELQKREEEEENKKQKKIPKEVQEILEQGEEYLRQIKRCNERIPGEEISGKISKMEVLTWRILEQGKEHPEIVGDLKKMMNYYLPMTVKLLTAYADMDEQPVQGQNIQSAKAEIDQTLDTLNIAFENLLDSIFKDKAWDVSSDVTVLHTLLAQDGLTDSDLRK